MNTEKRRRAIAQRLRLARENAGLSQGQVAKKLQLQRPSISEMEAGRRRVSAEELSALATLYYVDTAWLTGDETTSTIDGDRIELAARELAKLKPDDLNRVMDLLKALRKETK
jgi:transcriptional regulator with XRE-family HTH domain